MCQAGPFLAQEFNIEVAEVVTGMWQHGHMA